MPPTGHTITIDGEQAVIRNAAELAVALDVLQGQRDRAVLEQLASNLHEILRDSRGLYGLMRSISAEDQRFVIETLGTKLVGIVQNASTLRDLMALFGEEAVEVAALQTLGPDGLHQLIGTPGELSEVLEWTYGSSDKIALDLLGPEFLANIFQNGREVSYVLNALDREGQHQMLDMIGWEYVLALVHDRQDLAYLLRALPFNMSRKLLDGLSGSRVRAIVRDERGRKALERHLDHEEIRILDQLLEDSHA